ncbi:hypothetical protein TNCT_188281 [Trichonephila clavata]|uniref:Uncharacterized protein n=1 Tax=Trichonephila clavata TaxID=2740835 RepID=A0A8X6H3R1_TRICU|nr:hypothetical protein TNCT_188281 [Trichonephila clavata]
MVQHKCFRIFHTCLNAPYNVCPKFLGLICCWQHRPTELRVEKLRWGSSFMIPVSVASVLRPTVTGDETNWLSFGLKISGWSNPSADFNCSGSIIIANGRLSAKGMSSFRQEQEDYMFEYLQRCENAKHSHRIEKSGEKCRIMVTAQCLHSIGLLAKCMRHCLAFHRHNPICY